MIAEVFKDKDVLKSLLVTGATILVTGVKLALAARRVAQNES